MKAVAAKADIVNKKVPQKKDALNNFIPSPNSKGDLIGKCTTSQIKCLYVAFTPLG